MKLRFIQGQYLDGIHCNKCGAKRKGRIYRDLYEWRSRLSCGHERSIGYTKPMDVLEEECLINADLHTFDDLDERESEITINSSEDNELLQWKKKVAKMSTRNRTIY